jgi:hypothetical protein
VTGRAAELRPTGEQEQIRDAYLAGGPLAVTAVGVMLASEHGSGQTALLTDDGGYAFAPPGEAAA